jgi:hypothetical protein
MRRESPRVPIGLDEVLNCSGHCRMASKHVRRGDLLWRWDGTGTRPAATDARFLDDTTLAETLQAFARFNAAARIDPYQLSYRKARRLLGDRPDRIHDHEAALTRAVRELVRAVGRNALENAVNACDGDVDLDALDAAARELAALSEAVSTGSRAFARRLARVRQAGQLDDEGARSLLRSFENLRERVTDWTADKVASNEPFGTATFGLAMKLLRSADHALRRGNDAPRQPVGSQFENATANRILALLAGNRQLTEPLAEIWANVSVAEIDRPDREIAQWDVLFVLRNGVLVNIECKAGLIEKKDIDARDMNLKKSASLVAATLLCVPMARGHLAGQWFEQQHQLLRRLQSERRDFIVYCVDGQDVRYSQQGEVFEWPCIETGIAKWLDSYRVAGAAVGEV